MSKPNYPLVILIFVLTLIIFTTIALLLSRNNPPPLDGLDETTPKEESYNSNFDTNFNKTGNLIKNADNWDFLYEEPGKPALKVSLVFDSQSRCDILGQLVDCTKMDIETGTRAIINGNRTQNLVKVLNLVVFNENSQE